MSSLKTRSSQSVYYILLFVLNFEIFLIVLVFYAFVLKKFSIDYTPRIQYFNVLSLPQPMLWHDNMIFYKPKKI